MKPTLNFGLRGLAPGLLICSTVLLLATGSMAQTPYNDPLPEAIEEAEASREAALRELELRRAEYLDALRRAEALERREVARPSFADPLNAYGPNTMGRTSRFAPRPNPALNPRPYVLRQAPLTPFAGQGTGFGPGLYAPRAPMGPGLGYGGYGGYGPNYGYGPGYGAPGGIDVPFGFGLGGLSIRW